MARTRAEIQKAYRARLRKEAKTAPDQATSYKPGAFSTFYDEQPLAGETSFITETLDSVGINMPDLSRDEDPEWREDWGTEYRGSLGRAERMVDALIDSAKALAGLINQFKLQEIAKEIARLEEADLSDPQAKKQALRDIVRLRGIEARLSKETRHAFAPTTVKGE
ncbi:hypothetical protein K9U40_04910 [Xanthobacter autotrophicus]|uniref:hypothetical protein n=1 Tax=Xanthobacter TaxID=279 RepID=UPI0024AB6C3E|nr:hypothetical protein [Xanthobacter autotrophicus]MDI4663673.1 hypothetical protein [Xanthobacter autotrophicus]